MVYLFLNQGTKMMKYPLSEELILMYKKEIPLGEGMDLLIVLETLSDTNNVNSFEWFLSNLHNFKTKTAREFAVNNIYQFVRTSWIMIPQSLYGVLVDEFFTNIFKDQNYEEKSFIPSIFKTQNLIVHELYPKYWPEFFNTLIQGPKINMYYFLIYFNLSMYDNSSMHKRNVDEFQNNCLIDGSQEKILTVLVNDTLNGVELASNALISTVEWISLSILINQELINLFTQLLTKKETCVIGLKIFIKIFKRPIPLDLRCELFAHLNITGLIEEIISNFNNANDIVILCANLLFSIGQNITNTNHVNSILPLALNLFQIPDISITNFMYLLLIKIFAENPQLSAQCFPNLLLKITNSIALCCSSFSGNSSQANVNVDADQILEKALRTFLSATKNSNEDIIALLVNLTKDLNSSNIIEIASLITALQSIFSTSEYGLNDKSDSNDPIEHRKQEIILSTSQIFAPFLSINPPFTTAHYIAFSNYLKIINSVIRKLDPEFISQIFMKSLELLFFSDENLNALYEKKDLCEIIGTICQSIPDIIIQIPNMSEILLKFIQSFDNSLINAASTLVTMINPTDREQFYISTLQYFSDILNQKYVTNDFINTILDFWQHAKTDDLQQFQSILSQFFSALYSSTKINNVMYTNFVKASVSTIGINAFEIFWNSKEKSYFENASIIMKAALPLAQLPPDDIKLKQIFQLISNVLQNKNRSKKSMKQMDEVFALKSFYEATSIFLVSVIPNFQNNPSTQANLVSDLIKILVTLELSDSTINNIVLFALTVPSIFACEIDAFFEVFMQISRNYNHTGFPQQREILINLFHLNKILSGIVNNMTWESRHWKHFEEPFCNEGPEIMNTIMKSTDNEFESLVNNFLSEIKPITPSVYIDDYADDEDAYTNFDH